MSATTFLQIHYGNFDINSSCVWWLYRYLIREDGKRLKSLTQLATLWECSMQTALIISNSPQLLTGNYVYWNQLFMWSGSEEFYLILDRLLFDAVVISQHQWLLYKPEREVQTEGHHDTHQLATSWLYHGYISLRLFSVLL